MRLWLGGSGGRIAQIDTASRRVLKATLGSDAWIAALARVGRHLAALAGDSLWLLAFDDAQPPRVLRSRSVGAIEPADLCGVQTATRSAWAIAGGPGVIFLDAETFAPAGGFDVREGVATVRPVGSGTLAYASRDGYVGYHRIGTPGILPCFPPPDLGGVRVADLAADADGALGVSTRSGHLIWYDAPGPATGCERLSPGSLGGIAVTASHWLVATGSDVIGVPRKQGRRITLRTALTVPKTRLAADADTIVAVDASGGVWPFAVESLFTGVGIDSAGSIATDIRDAHALCS